MCHSEFLLFLGTLRVHLFFSVSVDKVRGESFPGRSMFQIWHMLRFFFLALATKNFTF